MLHNIDTLGASLDARWLGRLVPRQRGQQLKEVAHLDGWDRDGSRSFIESLCEFV
jgi:hypothetical protein